MRNVYFNNQVRSEQNLYEDITIEALKIYGQDVYYIPRDIVSEDRIFGDDIPSRFNSSYRLEMYIENIEGFDGEGDLFTRFGVEIRDEATFIVARRRWTQTVKRYDNEISGDRPREGDLIYLPLSKSLFQIMHVEHEQPFYQLNNLPTYKMRCTLFEYNDEDLDTGIQDVDAIEIDNAYTYVIRLNETSNLIKIGDTATQTLSDGTILTAEVSKWSDSDQILNLIHLGASDGDFHTFVSTQNITINDSDFTVETILADDNKISQNEQNDDFSTFSDDFIDFSENNPFGDPENS
jgi:hypothetical protein